jgi:2-polyprenyl-6-methoxyphenol hydroxylase-like FAD-dependent oxidoreductase
MNNRKILILGAGIAGPALAYWLQKYGFEPTIVECAPKLREGGYMLDFWGLGFDVAERMGLLPALKKSGYEIEEIWLVDGHGKRIGGFNWDIFHSTLGDRYVSILRGDLARLIYESLDGKVGTMFGDLIVAIEQDENGVSVTFDHAGPEDFDLVIGADGLHLRVREIVFGPESQFEHYLQYYVASFVVDAYPHRDAHAYVSYAAPARQVTRYSLRGGRTVFLFVLFSEAKLPVGHDLDAQKNLLHKVFGRDEWECPEILEALDGCSDLYFDCVSQIRMQRWSQGRVALIGDACFCPSLLAGQGSALAMTAAYLLAGELKKADGGYRKAFANYENVFQPFMAAKQHAAEKFAGSFAPRTRLGLFVRNHVVRLMFLPFVRKWTMGPLLSDQLILPACESI